ncbi:MAG: DUF2339 domain-containing protein, partial [bacterium]|nr:DUF2339 domain-containing protein [bacterium]
MADSLVFSLVMLVLVFLGTSVIGGLCGIIALVRLSGLRREIEALTYRLTQVQRRLHEGPVAPEQTPRTEPVEKPYVPPPVAAQPVPVQTSAVVSPPLGAIPPLEKPSPVAPAVTPPPSSIPPQRDREDSWELTLGTRWLNWVGIVFVMIAVAFFLKYAYDNNWIGPLGRLGLGTALGVFALGLGEKMRRGDYPILFHTLSGGAIGIFYVCIYFAFQVYTLLPPTAAFYLSILVTGLSVGLGVVHDTRILCI